MIMWQQPYSESPWTDILAAEPRASDELNGKLLQCVVSEGNRL